VSNDCTEGGPLPLLEAPLELPEDPPLLLVEVPPLLVDVPPPLEEPLPPPEVLPEVLPEAPPEVPPELPLVPPLELVPLLLVELPLLLVELPPLLVDVLLVVRSMPRRRRSIRPCGPSLRSCSSSREEEAQRPAIRLILRPERRLPTRASPVRFALIRVRLTTRPFGLILPSTVARSCRPRRNRTCWSLASNSS
jgi:hypothetical protein